jgi:Rho GDP-dissociation inhibitor
MSDQHDDLHAEQTQGFRVGEKKTLDEYQNLGT